LSRKKSNLRAFHIQSVNVRPYDGCLSMNHDQRGCFTMADHQNGQFVELTELSCGEMSQVQGGNGEFSINFTKIVFEYKPQKPD
jgi:hypothetical protein